VSLSKWIYRLIPETWISIVLLIAVVGAWSYWSDTFAIHLRTKVEGALSSDLPKPAVTKVPTQTSLSATIGASAASSSNATHQAASPATATSGSESVSSAEESRRQAISDRFAQIGQTGDLFGGYSALFSAVAFVGVFWAGALQRRQLIESRQGIAQDHFVTTFFELLRLTREVAEGISSPRKPATEGGEPRRWHGSQALNSIAAVNFGDRFPIRHQALGRVELLQEMVNVYKENIYSRRPSSLGPYFRLLYQTFDLVAKSPLSDQEKVTYGRIARGQISEGTVLLIALNGLTWRGRKFVDYIEEFGLLEHLSPSAVERYKGALLTAYRERAFVGSEERRARPTQAAPIPGPHHFDKDPDEEGFVVTRPMLEEDMLDPD